MASEWNSKYWGTRLNRRTLLRGGVTAVAGISAAALIGCGGSDEDTPATGGTPGGSTGSSSEPTAEARQGGVVRVAHPSLQNFDSLEQVAGSTQGAGLMIHEHIRQSLIETDDNDELIQGLAQDWERSPEGDVYIVRLRPNLTFHDGSPVDAESVVWSLERARSENPGFPNGQTAPKILPSAEAIDDLTVEVRLDTPVAGYLYELTSAGIGGSILSKLAHATESDPYGYGTGADSKPITAGAFLVDSFSSKERVVATAFDGHFNGRPNLDRIEWSPLPEDNTRITLLRTGEAQLAANIPPHEVAGLESDGRFTVDSRPGAKVMMLKVNQLREPFGPSTSDSAIKLRQALLHAIDRQAIIDNILNGQGQVADSPLVPHQFGYVSTKTYEYDPAEARALLDAAGWDWDYEIRLAHGEGFGTAVREVGQAIHSMLLEIGLKVNLRVWGDYGALVSATGRKASPSDNQQWDLTFSAWSMTREPSQRIDSINRSGDGLTLYDDPEMDELLQRQLHTVDDEERKVMLAEVQALHMERLPFPPLYYQYYTHAWDSRLKGVRIRNTESFDLRGAYLEA